MNSESFLNTLKDILYYIFAPGSDNLQEAMTGLIVATLAGAISFIFAKKYVQKLIRTERKLNKSWHKYILRSNILNWIIYLFPALTVDFFFSFYEIANHSTYLQMLMRLIDTFIYFTIFIIVLKLIRVFSRIFRHTRKLGKNVLKGYFQVIYITVLLVGLIIGICLILDESPWKILSGLGAAAAVGVFVFKDSILSTIANVQIAFYDLIRVGDYIEVKEYEADGIITEIRYHTVRVQNWNQSIVYIPTYKFMEISFKNWRSIYETCSRRIKNSLVIDSSSVKFCDQSLLEKLKKLPLLEEYFAENPQIDSTENFPLGTKQPTNLGLFRIYLKNYLRAHLTVAQDKPSKIRQLAPTRDGAIIEVFIFASETRWFNYEVVQSELFDHFLAAMRLFELEVITLRNWG